MRCNRWFLPLYLVLALLGMQQASATHVLGHALEQSRQQDQGKPHQPACDQCELYAQLGSALGADAPSLTIPPVSDEVVAQPSSSLVSATPLNAAARGPPTFS